MALNIHVKIWCCAWAVTAWWCMAVAGDCDVIVDGRSYTKDLIASDVMFPGGLAVDYSTNTMYFSFYNESWHSAKVNLDSKSFTLLKGLRRGSCSFTIDQKDGSVFAGCRTDDGSPGGLYEFDRESAWFVRAGETGQNVLSVQYYNDTLYYSSFNEEKLKTFNNGQSSPVTKIWSSVWYFVVDARGDIIYNNIGGVYRWQRDREHEMLYRHLGESVLTVDRRGSAYACSQMDPRGIWRLPERTRSAARLLDIDCKGLTFDAHNNIIYAEYDTVVRLLPC